MRHFVRLAYRGTNYRGWQRQPGGLPTVQGTLEAVLGRVERRPVSVVGCGRTDAGVHASDFVFHFDGPGPLRPGWVRIVNHQLPEDIRVLGARAVGPTDHARFGARERHYRYRIHRRPDPLLAVTSAHYELPEFDVARAREAVSRLLGRRDFRALCLTPDRHNTTVCELRHATVAATDSGYELTFAADRFLRGMIRLLVHQLLAVGRGELSPGELAEAVGRGQRRSAERARPEGLVLTRVIYDLP